MKSSELAAFGLKVDPLSKEIDDADLWLPTSKIDLVDDICDAIVGRRSVCFTGEPGVGKTCVLRAVRHRVQDQSFRLTYCHNATLGRRDFYRQLCVALGLTPSATAAGVFYAVSNHVEELGRDKVHPVFLLDEAHLLHQDVLDHLHILLNYQWDSRALLSLVLVGLPELNARLSMRRNRSLYSRIHHRFQLEPSTVDDTAEYLRHRLRLAGADREVFAHEAVALVHELAGGSLRGIDRIAQDAMREAFRRKKKLVDHESVARASGANVAA